MICQQCEGSLYKQKTSKCVCFVTFGNGSDYNSSMLYLEISFNLYFLFLNWKLLTLSSLAPNCSWKRPSPMQLSEWTSADMMELCNVQLNLPKFKLEETYDLKSTLSSMGMSDAFNQSKADFSGMSSERKLFLSNVFRKSFVEINEQGTDAAAGTGNEVSVRIKLPSIEFNADHPFLFFIRHNKTNCILFYGRFCSP